MKFIRLDKATVRCILTAEDMEEYNLDITDFIEQNEEAAEFINILLEKASSEVGRVAESGMATLGVAEMPGGNLVITISDSDASLEDFIGSSLKEKFDSLLKKLSQSGQKYEGERNELNADEVINNLIKDKNSSILSFKSLDDIGAFANSINYGRHIKSDIYKVNNYYILIIYRAKMAESSYVGVCFSAFDFGAVLREQDTFKDIIDEHGQILIRDKALQVMKNI